MSLWRRALVNNLALKLIALVSAVLLWSAIAREPQAEIGFNVPIEFHHVPENLEVISDVSPQAQVRLRGPARLVRDVAASDVHVVIDTAGASKGERTYEVTTADITVPYNVEVVQVVPSRVRLIFDRRATRVVEVRPRLTGHVAAGYHISGVTVVPAKVTIIGPEERVLAVEAALTDAIDASGLTGRMSFTTHAYVPDPLVRVSNPVPVRVTVEAVR